MTVALALSLTGIVAISSSPVLQCAFHMKLHLYQIAQAPAIGQQSDSIQLQLIE